MVTVLEVLQAYPVGVSQLLAALVPFAVVGAILMSDGLRLLSLWGEAAHPADRKSLVVTTTALLAVAGSLVLLNAVLRPLKEARSEYRANVPLKLHGATWIRAPRQQARALEQLTAAMTDCDPLVLYPGVNSFYIWTKKRPPTGHNATQWMTLFKPARQQSIVDAIKDKPGLCVLRNQKAIEDAINLSADRVRPQTPLVRYLDSTPLQVQLRVDDGTVAPIFELLKRPG
jgi:hypothetical protein